MNRKQKIQRELLEKGYVYSIDRWPRKATYYKPTGEALPNLPADPFSMEKYTRRGFTLTPPLNPVAPSENGDLKCEVCGFVAKSSFGLKAHQRIHKEVIHVNT